MCGILWIKEIHMAKKFILILVLSAALSGMAFSQVSPYKYRSMDMLLGIDFGIGTSINTFSLGKFPWEAMNYAATIDLGLNYDIYVFPWLSLSTGIMARTGLYLSLDAKMNDNEVESRIMDIAKTPISVAFPVAAHINVPYVNFLYLGAGVTFNFPLRNWSVNEFKVSDTKLTFGKKGDFFFSVPVDIGFDMVKAKGGGSRFILRLSPEFHKEGVFVPLGFMWQFTNFRIYSKKIWE